MPISKLLLYVIKIPVQTDRFTKQLSAYEYTDFSRQEHSWRSSYHMKIWSKKY